MRYLFYDTCALLNQAKTLFQEEDVKIFISNITLQELEDIKTSCNKDEETKYNARQVLHLLDENIYDKWEVIIHNEEDEKDYSLPNTNDSKIIIDACKCFERKEILDEGVFVTDDLCCKMLACTTSLKNIISTIGTSDNYCGYKEIYISEEGLAHFYETSFKSGGNPYDLLENEYLILKDIDTKELIAAYKYIENTYQVPSFPKIKTEMFGRLKAMDGDIYQQLALNSLSDNQITMIRGAAGTGKSYLSFGYLFYLLETNKIDKIIVFCNTVATKGSAKLGYYPGSRTEKLLDSQIGNFLESKLGGDRILVEQLINDGKLVLLPMSDIRGYDTTGMRAGVYITEAQNLDIELMRLALQRIGEDSICILDGDSDTQVDSSLYSGNNNGMRRVSEVFRGQDFYGEVTLKNIKRSRIAELAQQM